MLSNDVKLNQATYIQSHSCKYFENETPLPISFSFLPPLFFPLHKQWFALLIPFPKKGTLFILSTFLLEVLKVHNCTYFLT
jgi:hypothetical protein